MQNFVLHPENNTSPGSIGRRAIVLFTVSTMHVAIFILLIFSGQTTSQSQNLGGPSLFTLSASNTNLAVQTPVPIAPLIITVPMSIAVEAESLPGGAKGELEGEICSPLDEVTSQLVADPLVPLAIKRVARTDRSLSEAIVMWNVEWSLATAEDAPLAEVRRVVISVLKTLPFDCLSTPVAGPRLIAIPEAGSTTFLAIGSGEWSWQQLLETEPILEPAVDNEWPWEKISPALEPPTAL